MLQQQSQITHNTFQILFGDKKLKWDPFWNYWHWLCTKNQGHGLNDLFINKLLSFAFNAIPEKIEITQEYNIHLSTKDSGKWPDFAIGSPSLKNPIDYLLIMDDVDTARSGDKRKLDNLVYYVEHGKKIIKNGKLKLIVLTNTTDFDRFNKLRERLGEEFENSNTSFSWSLLSLKTVGEWIKSFNPQDNKLDEFIEWSDMFS